MGTAVTVEGAGGEYTVTVPATLNAGQVGTVTAKGYWAAEDTLKVTAPATIEVTNTATSQKATVNVDFDGIESLGNDLEEMNIPVSISVDKGNTKFGTWTGTIIYNVELVKPAVEEANLITFTIDGKEYQAEEGMTAEQWVNSDYSADNMQQVKEGVFEDNYGRDITLNGVAISADTVLVNGAQYVHD